MIRIDLHLHSSLSDGILSPSDLAKSLKINGVSVAALTDHDTLEGAELFQKACQHYSIKTVTGVELSTSYNGILHILGYRFDPYNEELRSVLEKYRQERFTRNLLICEKLRDLGLEIKFEEVRAVAGSDVVGRPHIAYILWSKGYVPTPKAAFSMYLGKGASAYVPRSLPSPEECIALIRKAGGFPVLAHPHQTVVDLEELPSILRPLKEAGLWGIECFYPGRRLQEIYRCLSIAQSFELYPTAGSDYHGSKHARVSIGMCVVDDLLPWAWFCGGL